MRKNIGKHWAELEELKKQNALSAVEYDQKVDSMSKSMMEWQKRLEIYALKFACINSVTELDAMESRQWNCSIMVMCMELFVFMKR